ncbi:hypothetical protein GCM10027452_01380 [Micromonospora halotolerans]
MIHTEISSMAMTAATVTAMGVFIDRAPSRLPFSPAARITADENPLPGAIGRRMRGGGHDRRDLAGAAALAPATQGAA